MSDDYNKPELEFSKTELEFYEIDKVLNEGSIDEGYRLIMDLISKNPEFGRAYNHLGWIYSKHLKNYQKAEKYYKKCLELSPDYGAVYLNYAYLLSDNNRFKELEELLNKALTVTGINISNIYNEFGIMYEVQGNFDKATESYKKAYISSIDSKSNETYKNSITRVKEKQEYLDNLS